MRYQRLSLRDAVNLAAPHTWTASIFPVLLGAALSEALTGYFSWLLLLLTGSAAVLMQSSVNTINDYFDFVRGTDRPEDSLDPSDAVLVYNSIHPRNALILGLGYLAGAMLLGVYPVIRGGIPTLGIGLFGCVVVVLYSAGNRSISYLPLGEVVSGGVMGGLIPLAVFTAMSGYADWRVLPRSAPLILGIGLIMMTNNTCDIERDTAAGRRTLPLVMGRSKAVIVYRILALTWIALILVLTALRFPKGLLFTGAVFLCAAPTLIRLLCAPIVPESRRICMSTVLKANLWLDGGYLLGIVAHILRE